MKATMSIDPTLIKMLGRKLYSSHSIPIIVRELLQNSVDACKRKGVIPQISISVVRDATEAKITCTDNGCGMSQQELLNDFLCLGGSSKRGTDSTGKFGIAKAAIMSGNYWEVHTLDNFISIDDLVEGNEIHIVEPLDGTSITVTVDVSGEWDYKRDMLAMIYLSDVDIHFHYAYYSTEIDDEHAGFLSQNIAKKILVDGDGWQGYGFDLATSENNVFQNTDFSGRVYVRLNNLVQYRPYASNLPEKTFLIDVDNVNCDPSSSDYPFTMSREDLVGSLRTDVHNWFRSIAENPMTVQYAIDLADMDTSVIFGRLCTGKRKQVRSLGSGNTIKEKVKDWEDSIHSAIKAAKNTSENPTKYVDNTKDNVLLKLYDYTEEDEVAIEGAAKVLAVWEKLLAIILPQDFEFALGLLGREHQEASYERNYGLHFFAINPKMVLSVETGVQRIMKMWISACHEAAHLSRSTHDEIFLAVMATIMEETSEQAVASISKLAKVFV